MAERPRRDALVVGDSEVVFLEPADLVAEARGFFELEVCGGLAHALLEVSDIGLEVVPDEVRPLLVAGVNNDTVALSHVGKQVVEPVYMWIVYALAAIGLFLVPWSFRALALLLFAYQSFWAALFVGATRYRIAFDFLLALLAATALARLWERRRA